VKLKRGERSLTATLL